MLSIYCIIAEQMQVRRRQVGRIELEVHVAKHVFGSSCHRQAGPFSNHVRCHILNHKGALTGKGGPLNYRGSDRPG